MKKHITLSLLILAGVLMVTSCSDDDSATPNNNTPATGNFTWKENGGSVIVADSAYYESQYKTIKAFKGANHEKFVEINLTADAAATYPVNSGNAVSFMNATGIYAASAGSIIISQKSATAMSGTITSTGTGAGVTSLDATFTNIEVR